MQGHKVKLSAKIWGEGGGDPLPGSYGPVGWLAVARFGPEGTYFRRICSTVSPIRSAPTSSRTTGGKGYIATATE